MGYNDDDVGDDNDYMPRSLLLLFVYLSYHLPGAKYVQISVRDGLCDSRSLGCANCRGGGLNTCALKRRIKVRI